MIEDVSSDGLGWARFSDDRSMRYRLDRMLSTRAINVEYRSPLTAPPVPIIRVVFVMLNPSTADAFVLDPTVRKCCQFAVRWKADVLEVVNLFALRSTDPKALYKFEKSLPADCGADLVNNNEILAACSDAARVIAAWGNHGELNGRGDAIRSLLTSHGVELEHLGLTGDGYPLHPLARGKSFIPLDREPVRWAV
jgi:hypothetical protein